MQGNQLLGLSAIPLLGVSSQWLSWRLKLPSILLLLSVGILAGPVTGLLNPDKVFGDLLFPVVSLCVALILFEGGMSLHVSELKDIGKEVRSLTTTGPVIGWVLGSLAAHYVGGLPRGISALVGAILVVTGPTVIGPLLRSVRVKGKVGPIVRWESIVNDPTGAVLAVLIFEVLLEYQLHPSMQGATLEILRGAVKTGAIGFGVGMALAGGFILALYKRWIPDYLHSPIVAALVLFGFAISNSLQEESGLVTVTVMGIALVNQRLASVKHIFEFLENLRVLLISALFIVLAARLTVEDLALIDARLVAFLVVLILVVRPATIFLSLLRSDLTRNEKLFISWMAPRGIVAAAVASVFAIRLEQAGLAGAERIVPTIFMVIVCTVILYGLTARSVARYLGLLEKNPQGAIILGANRVAQTIGLAMQAKGIRVILLDTNWRQISAARLKGLEVVYGNAFSAKIHHKLDIDGIGRLFAMTPNDQLNALACVHYVELFGRNQVYQLAPEMASKEGFKEEERPIDLHGHYLFEPENTYHQLDLMITRQAEVKFTNLTSEFTIKSFRERYGSGAVPMFLILPNGEVKVFDDDDRPSGIGTLVSLVSIRALKDADSKDAGAKGVASVEEGLEVSSEEEGSAPDKEANSGEG